MTRSITNIDTPTDRVRRVVKRSNYGHVYKFCSQKCGRIVELESGLEYDLAIIYEFDPSIICYQEQPLELIVNIDDESRRIFPDFLVFRDDGSATIEEVKPYEKSQQQEQKKKFQAEKELAESNGFWFQVITENEIRSGLKLQNSRKLLPFRRIPIGGLLRESVLNALRWRPMTACEMLGQIPGLTESRLFTLLAQGYIVADLSFPLNLNTLFSHIVRQPQLSQNQQRVWERRCI